MKKKITIITTGLIAFAVLFFYKESAVAPVFVPVGEQFVSSEIAKSKQIVDAEYKKGTAKVGKELFNTLIADTEALRAKGLSGRTGLDTNQAMVFVFNSPDMLGFWMKDMLFSIDMLWLDANYRVVSFEKNVSPDTYPKVFFPTSPSLYVIEFSAGTLDRLGVVSGDYVEVR